MSVLITAPSAMNPYRIHARASIMCPWLPTSITRKGVVVEAPLTRYLRVRLDARCSGVVTKWSKVTVCKTVSTGSNPVDASIFFKIAASCSRCPLLAGDTPRGRGVCHVG